MMISQLNIFLMKLSIAYKKTITPVNYMHLYA